MNRAKSGRDERELPSAVFEDIGDGGLVPLVG
jgi:hypothetical protein